MPFFRLLPLAALLFLAALASAQGRTINVSVNTNVEVINALTVARYPELMPDSAADPVRFENARLMRLARDWFAPADKHPAAVKAAALLDRLGTGVYLLALYYEPLPAVKRRHPLPKIIWQELSAHEDSALTQVDDFFRAAADYYRAARFEAFRVRYRSVYDQALAQVRRNLPDRRFLSTLEAYYGDQKAGYNIVVMPFFKSDWGMGWETTSANGRPEIYNIASPFGPQTPPGRVRPDAGYNYPEKIANLSVHEFGHSFVNPLTAAAPFAQQLQQHASLFRPVPGQAQYSDWTTLFNEHVVRAGEVLVMRQLGKPALAEEIRRSYKDWPYLDFFIAQLDAYMNDRNRYPSFRAYLPTLINHLSSLK